MISKYAQTYTPKSGRTWYTEKYVIENLGPDVLMRMKTDEEMIQGVTHKMVKKCVESKTEPGVMDLIDEWVFCKEVIEVVRKELAYERLKKREGRYKVNGKDYAGYVMCFIVRGYHQGLRRMVIAQANNYTTYLNTRKRTIIESIIFCKRIDTPNRKFLFQRLHEHCDGFFKEEEVRLTSRAMFEVHLGLESEPPVITRPPQEHTYLVPEEYRTGQLKTFMEEQIQNLKRITKCTIKKNGDSSGARREELRAKPVRDL